MAKVVQLFEIKGITSWGQSSLSSLSAFKNKIKDESFFRKLNGAFKNINLKNLNFRIKKK